MKFLVLGGTVFLGRHVVESALARGHSVTLFNRGRQNPNLFPKVEKLRGDRDGDLSALSGRRFDAVIDTSTYTPGQAYRMAKILIGGSSTTRSSQAFRLMQGFRPGARTMRPRP